MESLSLREIACKSIYENLTPFLLDCAFTTILPYVRMSNDELKLIK